MTAIKHREMFGITYLTQNELKVAELNDKGVDAKNIAKEVGISVQSVYGAIKNLELKKRKCRATLEVLKTMRMKGEG